MMKRILSKAAILASVLVTVPASAQNLGELLEEVGESYAELYLQPLADALGANMNTGLFHTARIGGGLVPLVDIYAGVKVMGAFVSGDDKRLSLFYETEQVFTASDGNRYRVPVTFDITDAPTVFGESSPGRATARINTTVDPGPDGTSGTSDDIVIDTTATFDLLPGVVDTPIAPFFVPQIGLGSVFGTDIVIRYLPRVGYGDVGSVGFRGLGVRHSLSQYIPLFPVNLSAQVVWQGLSIQNAEDDEIFSASAFAANLAASKSFLVLTLYGGLQLERSSVDIQYTFIPEDPALAAREIDFGLIGDNRFRLIGGGALSLGVVNVNVDLSVGRRSVVSGGVGLVL